MKIKNPKTLRRWLVSYTFSGGTGRVFMTTDDVPITEELVKNMDKFIADEYDTVNPFVTNIIPLELVENFTPVEQGETKAPYNSFGEGC